jgi:hypothetical protein
LLPCMWDGPVHTEGHQGQATENIFYRDDIQDRMSWPNGQGVGLEIV